MPRFSEIIGQANAVQVLRRAVAGGRVAHAYLFVGPEGVGKVTTARALAAALNCETAPGEGCNTCLPCRKLAGDLHPDLIRVIARGLQILVDQVREVEEHLAYPPHEGKVRVVVLDGADQLNLSAANALLKSLEEPRPRNVFVLSTAAPHRLVPTLVSRCQRIRFGPLQITDLQALLRRNFPEAEAEGMATAATLAEGSAGRACRLMEQEQIATLQQTAELLLGAIRGSTTLEVFEAAARAGRDRIQICEALDLVRTRLRSRLLAAVGLDAERSAVQDAGASSPDAGQSKVLLRQLRVLDEVQAAVRGNVNPTLALEHMIIVMREARAWQVR